ncbi:MAG: aromatic ring-hydroxylating dioxygenase subunit alpha [Bacteroidia bacterium]|nr:aromatic ring-hydroxylating dioxygenase subunit alpha [Bacteroidia bacterium]
MDTLNHDPKNQSVDLSINPDIRQAYTLPTEIYKDAELFEKSKDSIFAKTWQCIGLKSLTPTAGNVQPFVMLNGFLGEPLVLSRDNDDELHCLSNVCTHRGNLMVHEAGPCRDLVCRYHGRRFDLKGKFKSMPEFKEAENFPSEEDHLPSLPLHNLGDLLFTSLDPAVDFEKAVAPIRERVGWMPLESFQYSAEHSQVYEVQAHWALYVDNFLEGFHLPFVHPALSKSLSYSDYGYEIFDYCNLQLGVGKPDETVFDLPEGHPDYGKRIRAFYFWLFPNIMLNYYPWGLSLNLIEPISPTHTKIRFETFLWKEELFDPRSQDLLHVTEMEDEEVVEAVQAGVRSRLYKRGRFSPKMEPAVHHFHSLISKFMK